MLPLSLAFGPVAHRLDALNAALADTQRALAERTRAPARPSARDQLTAREYAVLRAMAQKRPIGIIARQLHLSLSSVAEHATSIFRKLQVNEGPEVHRRVAVVVAYRDALEQPDAEHRCLADVRAIEVWNRLLPSVSAGQSRSNRSG